MQKRLLRNQVEERTQQLATLNAVGREITATLDLDAVLESLYNNMNRMLDAKVFGIGLYHAEKGEIEFRLAMQNGQRYKPYSRRMEDKSQLAVWCVDHCEPVLIGDYPNEYQQYVEECDSTVHTLFDGSESRQPKSLLYVPIVLQEQVIGVLSVQSFATHAYRRQHLDLLQTLASYAAIAIDNGRAHADLLIAYETMQEVSVTDQLTGLKNRRFLALHFKEDVNKTLRDYANWEVGLKSEMPKESDHVFFLLDLDHFKQVNDTYGHAAGDCVLVEIKNLLTKVFRDSDFLIRWGGEEFLVITRFTKRSSAVVLAERIRSAIEQHKFDIGDGQIIKMTSSIGFTAFPFIPKQYKALTWEQVINIADYCLYVAKNNQRNAWVGVFSGEMTEGEKFLKCLTHSPENLLVDHDLEVVTSIPDEQEIKW